MLRESISALAWGLRISPSSHNRAARGLYDTRKSVWVKRRVRVEKSQGRTGTHKLSSTYLTTLPILPIGTVEHVPNTSRSLGAQYLFLFEGAAVGLSKEESSGDECMCAKTGLS